MLSGSVLSVSALIAMLVDVIVVALVIECARVVLFELPTEHVRVARTVGRSRGRLARLADEVSALGQIARAVRDLPDGDDPATAAREAAVDVRRYVTNRLALLRLLGPAASCTGLAGAAAQMSWLQADHGLLDLDPDRVLRMAVDAGSVCMALGIAGSTTAIGALYFLRPRAGAIHAGMDRFVEQVSAPPATWTRVAG